MRILVGPVFLDTSFSSTSSPLVKAKGGHRGHKRIGGKGSSHKGSRWDSQEDQEWDAKAKNERQEFVLENASVVPLTSPPAQTLLSEEELQARLEAEPWRKPDFWKDVLAGRIASVQLPDTPPQPAEDNRSVEGIRRIWDFEIIGDAPFPGRRIHTPVGDVILRPDNFEHPFTEIPSHSNEPVLRRDRARFIRYLIPTLEIRWRCGPMKKGCPT